MHPPQPRRRVPFTPSGIANRVAPRPSSSAWGGGGALEAQVRQFLTGASAAEHYDLSVLRLGGIAPPTLPPLPRPGHTTARDGDLARQDARMRYSRQLLTRSQLGLAQQQAQWADALAGRGAEPTTVMYATPEDDYHTQRAQRLRLMAYKSKQAWEQQARDQPEMTTIIEGVGHGLKEAPFVFAPELLGLRIAAGLGYANEMRTAVVARNLALASEAEFIGGRAAWQGYRGAFAKTGWTGVRQIAVPRAAADGIAQLGGNYLSSDKQGVARVGDAFASVNLVETGMALYGLRPAGIGVGSAFLQLSWKSGFQSPLNNEISWTAFGAQAAIGTVGGYSGQLADHFLSKRLAYRLYTQAALRVGPQAAYPVWLGSAHLFRTVTPHGIGVTEEYLENKAQDEWPVDTAGVAPAAPLPEAAPPMPNFPPVTIPLPPPYATKP